MRRIIRMHGFRPISRHCENEQARRVEPSEVTPSTLAESARYEVEIRKSRFLAQAGPVGDADAALAFLRAVRDDDATHNCWAYRIGASYRSFDDGEPAGTAGRPILAAVDGQACDRVMIVVTRWFGGTKLGAGGLVRAYGGVAAECLRRAIRIPLIDTVRMTVICGFEHAGSMHQSIVQHGAEKLAERYDSDGLQLDVQVPRDRLPALQNALRDATRGQVRVLIAGESANPMDEDT
jgi:putative IMPACT (imprinted ancient) family translation regulator